MSLSPQQALFRARVEADTGLFARHICRYNYDQHHETNEMFNVGTGGVRNYGPHLEMSTFMDNRDTRLKHLEAPRGSLKTSMLEALAMRTMLGDRNARILYGMEVNAVAKQSLARIKKLFEKSPRINDLWGDVVSKDDEWSTSAITLAGCSLDKADKEPGLCTFGIDKTRTGGHYSLIIADDLVNDENVKNKDGIEKVLRVFKGLAFLLDPGGTMIICGTRYHDDDLYGHILKNLEGEFDTLILDCGMELQTMGHGKVELVGGPPTFEHLGKEFLEFQFNFLKDPGYFSSQYLNKCLSSAQMLFFREQFVSMHWEDRMDDLSCYLLVDTAVSEKDEGCYTAGSLIGLDSEDRAYVLDMFVGHLNPMEVVRAIIDIHEKWESRVPIRKILLEKIALNATFKVMIQAEARIRQVRLGELKDVARGTNLDSKRVRIAKLQQRFQTGSIAFVDTIPRVYHDLGETKVLYDPEGYGFEDTAMPDGELVKEFIRFPSYGKNDIPDSIADIDALDRQGNRICTPGNRRKAQRRKEKRRRAGQLMATERMVNGRKQLVDVLATSEHTGGKSFIERYMANRR